jgi:hypothetical protein
MALKGKRAPSAALAKARAAVKKNKLFAKQAAAKVEEKFRNSGGYGKGTVSIWDEPKGGLKNSPAYRKVLARCGGGTMPKPQDRAGAPVNVKGAFPLAKYPPNVLVDGQRAFWLPDDWAQVVKNTGPGGTYIGWMSPEGKFFYHRNGYPSAVEESLGRSLTAVDGWNGIQRQVALQISKVADKKFLTDCLTASERKHIAPAEKFHFGVVSARRATDDQGIYNIMIVESHFRANGIKPTWYVDGDSLKAYQGLGLIAKVGGKLTPARNMVLKDAASKGRVCVQVSDDISKWQYYDVSKQDFRGEVDFKKANAALAGSRSHVISPLAAAQFVLAKMRSLPGKPKLGGVFPTNNASMTLGTEEFSHAHFILGDFFVADLSPIRFDETMTLKEDYDYSCSHIHKHGSVLRCNRLFVQARHSTNPGGAVAVRDGNGSKERENIAILQRKWPGVFKLNVKRDNEVLMKWQHYGKTDIQDESKAVKKTTLKTKARKAMSAGKAKLLKQFPLSAKVKLTGEGDATPYIMKRCKKADGKTVQQVLAMEYTDASGATRKYGMSDLKYDVSAQRLRLTGA